MSPSITSRAETHNRSPFEPQGAAHAKRSPRQRAVPVGVHQDAVVVVDLCNARTQHRDQQRGQVSAQLSDLRRGSRRFLQGQPQQPCGLSPPPRATYTVTAQAQRHRTAS